MYRNPTEPPEVLFQNELFWVVYKPSGWLSIPGRDGSDEGFEDNLSGMNVWLQQTSGQKVWVVHRIDQMTSGIMLFAKSAESHRELNILFENRLVQKKYICFIEGVLFPPQLICKVPLDGKSCETKFQMVDNRGAYSKLEAAPRTGRFHQIRKHLLTLGKPILGDKKYGGNLKSEIPQMGLHASELNLGKLGMYSCPLPKALEAWWDQI